MRMTKLILLLIVFWIVASSAFAGDVLPAASPSASSVEQTPVFSDVRLKRATKVTRSHTNSAMPSGSPAVSNIIPQSSVSESSKSNIGVVGQANSNDQQLTPMQAELADALQEWRYGHPRYDTERDKTLHLIKRMQGNLTFKINIAYVIYCATPLSIAAYRGDLEMVQTLVDHGAGVDDRIEVDTPECQGHTGLMKVASLDPRYKGTHNLMEILRYLLDHGADPNIRDVNGYTALSYAMGQRNLEAARLLVEHGATADIRSPDPKKGMWLSVLNNPIAAMNMEEVVNELDLELAKLALEHGASQLDKDQALFAIFKTRHVSAPMVKLLLDHGANPNQWFRDTNVWDGGESLLAETIMRTDRRWDIAELLIGAGASLTDCTVEAPSGGCSNVKHEYLASSLFFTDAVLADAPQKLLDLMLAKGYDINSKDTEGLTALDRTLEHCFYLGLYMTGLRCPLTHVSYRGHFDESGNYDQHTATKYLREHGATLQNTELALRDERTAHPVSTVKTQPFLLSSITGQIVDEESGKPIAGAIVAVTWHAYNPGGPGGGDSVCLHAETAKTDAVGHYRMPDYHGYWSPENWMLSDRHVDLGAYKSWYVYGKNWRMSDNVHYAEAIQGNRRCSGSIRPAVPSWGDGRITSIATVTKRVPRVYIAYTLRLQTICLK